MKLEELPPHRRAMVCEDRLGHPDCMGQAAEHGCTCEKVTPEQHEQCLADGWRHYSERLGRACHDCAFRAGSPEEREGMLERILQQEGHFYCHQGMPIRVEGGRVCVDEYEGTADQARQYPVCAGYLAALKARARGMVIGPTAAAGRSSPTPLADVVDAIHDHTADDDRQTCAEDDQHG